MSDLPDRFTLLTDEPHPYCALAAAELQQYLTRHSEWNQNFGLQYSGKGTVVGKMFGVLAVQTNHGELGYLAAFSGKLAGRNNHPGFVPPVFDALTENSFLNIGMAELTRINLKISKLESNREDGYAENINTLKELRRKHSNTLQKQLFDNYIFLNRAGDEKSLNQLFSDALYKNPPAGAGECAGPKLLQYAFLHQMRPLALAEFWWGQSPKSDQWKHRKFYPCCVEKCGPILTHMLHEIDFE